MLNNPNTSVSSQLPPNAMQGGMIVTGGDNKTMMTNAPQMMSKLVPISMHQQQQLAHSMVAAQQHPGHPQQIHLVPQQSVQPLQQHHSHQAHHKMVMAGTGDKPVMPVTAAVMTPVMPGTLMQGTSILSNSQLMQQGMMAHHVAQQNLMPQQPPMLTTMQPPISVPAGLTVAAVPSGTIPPMMSPATTVSSTSTMPMMTTAVGVQGLSHNQRDDHSQQANMSTPPVAAISNSIQNDISTTQQNGVQPMDVTESADTPESKFNTLR